MKNRVAVLVYVDTDPDILVADKAEREAILRVATVLDEHMNSRNPLVSLAPDELQPQNRLRGATTSQEIPTPAEVASYMPIAGSAPENTKILRAADIAQNYNLEGHVEA